MLPTAQPELKKKIHRVVLEGQNNNCGLMLNVLGSPARLDQDQNLEGRF